MDPSRDELRPWVRTAQKGLLVAATVATFLMVALGLVAAGLFFVFLFAMNNYGSNK